MRLAIILATIGICGLSYAVYSSVVGEKYKKAWEIHRVEGKIGELLDQLVEHVHVYTEYYERCTWETHIATLMTRRGMAMPQGEQRDALRVQMGEYVKQLNMYKNSMGPFYKQELDNAWNIFQALKDMELHNPEQAALFNKYCEEIVPYLLEEKYPHPTMVINEEDRKQIIWAARNKLIQRVEEYAETHKEILQWEQDYAHIKGEHIMAQAELATAKVDMEAADHALALMLAENRQEEVINNAIQQAAEQTALFKQAQLKAAEVDMAMMQLETARMDMQVANNDRLEQVLIAHQQPREELHPNLPRGARVVPGKDAQPPPAGGGWWHEFVQWICSWIM